MYTITEAVTFAEINDTGCGETRSSMWYGRGISRFKILWEREIQHFTLFDRE
jgi:hypothetical protein